MPELNREFYAAKARKELNETETRKEQSLRQFKEWIAKHPFISNAYPADSTLLAMLRTKKYSMDKVFEAFERIQIAAASVPYFNKISSRSSMLADNNIFYVLKERDASGCRTIYIDYARCPVEKFDEASTFLNGILTHLALCTEDETQICGVNYLVDTRKLTLEHLRKYCGPCTPVSMNLSRYSCVRVKKMTIFGMPGFAAASIEILRSFLSEKLRKRFEIVKSIDFEVTDDMLEDVRGRCEEIDSFVEFGNVKVNFEAMARMKGHGNVGSFRKLEID